MERPTHVWIYDINRRVYRRDEKGHSYGSPIYREHWEKCEVVAETSRSWICKYGKKVPKRGGDGFIFSEEDLDKHCYVNDNRHIISEKVRYADYEQLKRIAEIIGYKEVQ